MPIHTTGLLFYWNAKQGRSGNALANIAPGGAVLPINFVGATYDTVNGRFTFDGVDDYATLATAGTAMVTSQSFTFEYVYEVLNDFNDNDWHELLDGGAYFDHDYSVPGMYVTMWQSGARVNTTITTTAVNDPRQMHIQWIYDAVASTIRFFVNGVKVFTRTGIGNMAFASATAMRINGGLQHPEFNVHFNAMRFYNVSLTDAQAAANYANGLAVGLTEPEVKIGVYRAKNAAAGFTDIPVYSITNHPGEKLRMMTSDGLGFIPLVATTDPNASRIRVRVGTTTMAMRK